MKALSLWQPWASAIAIGAKTIETRSWYTSYRGPLAIHAAKRCIKSELILRGCEWIWRDALNPILDGDRPLWEILPFGAIVAVCTLFDCQPTESFNVSELDTLKRPTKWNGDPDSPCGWTERQMGNFSPGRFGWVLSDVRALAQPLFIKGKQGLFDVILPSSKLQAG
jgi:hypothetical protein